MTSAGPTGEKPGKDFPIPNCAGGAANWATRSERSWPRVSPATWSHPSASAIAVAASPDHRDELDLPVDVARGERRTSARGPVKLEGYLVKTTGSLGSAKPDSAAWSR